MNKSGRSLGLAASWAAMAALVVFVVVLGHGPVWFPLAFLVLYLHDWAGGRRAGTLALAAGAALVAAAFVRSGTEDFQALAFELAALGAFAWVFRRLRTKRGKIADQAQQLAALVEALPVGISVLGPERQIVLHNAELSRILRLDPAGMDAQTYRHRRYFHPDGRPMAAEEFATSRALAGEASVPGILTGIDLEDGGRLWVQVSARTWDQGPWRVLTVTSDVTAMKEAQDRADRLLQENQVLLHEVHHRVKNNFSTVRALLFLQAQTVAEPSAQGALMAASARVLGMAEAYSALFERKLHDAVDAGTYLGDLCRQVLALFDRGTLTAIDVTADGTLLGPDQAPALGMAVNELLTNSCKHAWAPGEAGRVTLTLGSVEGEVVFTYADSGPGLGAAVREGSFGMNLLDLLTRSLGGRLERQPEAGIQWRLRFPRQRG